MRRREFTKLALAGAVGAVAAPAVVQAQTTFNWKMTSFYGPNAAFYSTGPGSAKDLIKRIDDMSAGRIKIQFYGAGELIPAGEGFDAVSAGTVEMNYANAYFWTGKLFAGQYFTAVPFGLNFQGFNGWMYDGGGLQLWREAYDRFNLVPFLCGNTGVQMTGWFKKPIEKVDDLKGLKMRIPGPRRARVSIARRGCPAVAPWRNLSRARTRRDRCRRIRRPLSRPPARAAARCQILLHHWLARDRDRKRADRQQGQVEFAAARPQGHRRERLRRMQCDQRGVVPEKQCRSDGRPDQESGRHRQPLPDPIVEALRDANAKIIAENVAKDPLTKKVNDSYQVYLEKFRQWSGYSEAVYHSKILKG